MLDQKYGEWRELIDNFKCHKMSSILLKKLYHTVAMKCLECSRIGYDLFVGSLIFPQNCKMILTSKQSQ